MSRKLELCIRKDGCRHGVFHLSTGGSHQLKIKREASYSQLGEHSS